ncbi:MAG: undecaprenyl/decaprenyl-phosphate alpha-N-acetylglucosaminyl 1-phosphate transferase [Propionibacteriaceae bacterium]|nr:undecaprenyl/decaprenyl-phosphate alpha-N-acetylglucosaminyl 1-phosphate transferase [Propionibacteriaceae bacterium]
MREYVLVLLVAAAGCYLTAGLWRRIASRSGAIAVVRERDVHSTPTPYFGGVAMLMGVGLAFLLALHLPWLSKQPVVTHDALGIFLAALVICVVGAIDDAIDLPVIAKVFGQVLAAGVAVLFGVRMYWLSLPGAIYTLDPIASTIVTVVFIFVCVNAINLVDGLDGLAAGVVGIGASAMFCYTYFLARWENLLAATTASLVTVAITGVCLGFLPHNVHPAKMFMGDSGSMLLGLLLACSTISFTGQLDASVLGSSVTGAGVLPAWLPLILPIAIMFLPLLDLVMAYIRRTISGKWWFQADKQHLHHRLIERGHSQVSAVVVMYLWTAVIAYGVMGVALLRTRLVVGLTGLAFVVAAVVTIWPWLVKKMAVHSAGSTPE